MQCSFLSAEGAKIYFPDANYLLVSADVITGDTQSAAIWCELSTPRQSPVPAPPPLYLQLHIINAILKEC